MGKPYPAEPRAEVVRTITSGEATAYSAARSIGVATTTVRNWVRIYARTGRLAPAQIGGRRPHVIRGGCRDWLLRRAGQQDYTVRELMAELERNFSLFVSYQTVCNFLTQENLLARRRRERTAAGPRRSEGDC